MMLVLSVGGIRIVQDGASVSLEPGGQFELSGAPLEDIHACQRELDMHLEQVRFKTNLYIYIPLKHLHESMQRTEFGQTVLVCERIGVLAWTFVLAFPS